VLPEINDLMMILPMSAVVYIAGIFFRGQKQVALWGPGQIHGEGLTGSSEKPPPPEATTFR